jgi:hypothetical protein
MNRVEFRPRTFNCMKRREFLKTSLTASTFAGLSTDGISALAEQTPAGREFYELRNYHLKDDASRPLLHNYLEKAAIPAWNRAGIKPAGVFLQQERKTPDREEMVDPLALVVLLPHPSMQSVVGLGAKLSADTEFQKAGAEYLQRPKTNPAVDRINSWLMLAFAGMPRIELAPFSREKKPRMFEIRTYESYSEVKALKKVEMFNSGEIETMREVGLAPVFYGQALIGYGLPHLTYMLSAEDETAHKKHWQDFGKHPVWNKLKNDHQYDDTVSKITKRFLVPATLSQI